MELLYFISGILSVGIIYGMYLLRTVKSSHAELLDTFNKSQYISSTRRAEIKERLEDLEILIKDIQTNMEKDQYENLSTLTKRIGELDKLANATNNRLGESNKVFNKNVTDAFNEIQQLKNRLKALGQDPNMLSRY